MNFSCKVIFSILLATSSPSAAAISSYVLPLYCSKRSISLNSPTPIPKAWAKACCWITFKFWKSLKSPIWPLISSINPVILLVRAKYLALSKLSSLPVNSSASNSADIESSNLSKELAIWFTPAKVVPKAVALATASVKAVVEPLNWAKE